MAKQPIEQNPERYTKKEDKWIVSALPEEPTKEQIAVIKPLELEAGKPIDKDKLVPLLAVNGIVVKINDFYIISPQTLSDIKDSNNPHYDIIENGKVLEVTIGKTIPIIELSDKHLVAIGNTLDIANKNAGVKSVDYIYETELEKEFNRVHNFQTSTRGLKIRGSYPTMEEAELRCKMLREIDSNHDIMVGPVGLWMPWDPEAYKTGRVEYMEEELNQLMHEKSKNETNAKTAFEQRVKETKQKAIEENIKKAEKTGNTLSQTIDQNGNLIGVNNTNTTEFALGESENISTADICKELFDSENVVIGKTDYGKSQLKSGPFANKK
jgi:hypothetical protein